MALPRVQRSVAGPAARSAAADAEKIKHVTARVQSVITAAHSDDLDAGDRKSVV